MNSAKTNGRRSRCCRASGPTNLNLKPRHAARGHECGAVDPSFILRFVGPPKQQAIHRRWSVRHGKTRFRALRARRGRQARRAGRSCYLGGPRPARLTTGALLLDDTPQTPPYAVVRGSRHAVSGPCSTCALRLSGLRPRIGRPGNRHALRWSARGGQVIQKAADEDGL